MMTFSGQAQNGCRVEIPPHTDEWMRGDRYGEVIHGLKKGFVHIKLDKSGKTIRIPHNVAERYCVTL